MKGTVCVPAPANYMYVLIKKYSRNGPKVLSIVLIYEAISGRLNPCLLVMSADNLCKLFGPRSVETKRGACQLNPSVNTLSLCIAERIL